LAHKTNPVTLNRKTEIMQNDWMIIEASQTGLNILKSAIINAHKFIINNEKIKIFFKY